MPAAAGYDPQDPTWMREGADLDEHPASHELDPLPDVTKRPKRFIPDPWQPDETEGDCCEPF